MCNNMLILNELTNQFKSEMRLKSQSQEIWIFRERQPMWKREKQKLIAWHSVTYIVYFNKQDNYDVSY